MRCRRVFSHELFTHLGDDIITGGGHLERKDSSIWNGGQSMTTRSAVNGHEQPNHTLNTLDYLELLNYYSDAASATKKMTWTMTQWLLALGAAVIAYCFAIYMDHSTFEYLLFFEWTFCAAGFALCLMTLFLIDDH
jgi:hypothetical protein